MRESRTALKKRVPNVAEEPRDELVAGNEEEPPRNVGLLADPERIARLAYERFEMRGRVHGLDQEDWYEAERALKDRRTGQPQQ